MLKLEIAEADKKKAENNLQDVRKTLQEREESIHALVQKSFSLTPRSVMNLTTAEAIDLDPLAQKNEIASLTSKMETQKASSSTEIDCLKNEVKKVTEFTHCHVDLNLTTGFCASAGSYEGNRSCI